MENDFEKIRGHPKAILVLLNCISNGNSLTNISQSWYPLGSTVLSRHNAMTFLINNGFLVIDRKDGKTSYYKADKKKLTEILLNAMQRGNAEIIVRDFREKKKQITSYWNNPLVKKFFENNVLHRAFKDAESLEKGGIEYLLYIFSLRYLKFGIKLELKEGERITSEQIDNFFLAFTELLEHITPDIRINYRVVLDEFMKMGPKEIESAITTMPEIKTKLDVFFITAFEQHHSFISKLKKTER